MRHTYVVRYLQWLYLYNVIGTSEVYYQSSMINAQGILPYRMSKPIINLVFNWMEKGGCGVF